MIKVDLEGLILTDDRSEKKGLRSAVVNADAKNRKQLFEKEQTLLACKKHPNFQRLISNFQSVAYVNPYFYVLTFDACA